MAGVVLVCVRIALTLALILWVASTAPLAVAIALGLLLLTAELGSLGVGYLWRRLDACEAEVAVLKRDLEHRRASAARLRVDEFARQLQTSARHVRGGAGGLAETRLPGDVA